MKTNLLRIVGLLIMMAACGSSDGVGVDAGLMLDADPLAPDADPTQPDAMPVPDADLLAPDADRTQPDAAAVTPSVDAGVADAGFEPWASWNAIYSMAWVETGSTCMLSGFGYLPGWNYVRLYNTETPMGQAFYENIYDVPALEAAAQVVGPGAMTIDGVAWSMNTMSPCAALQTSATTFQCVMIQHINNDPGGPCDVTRQMTATFVAL